MVDHTALDLLVIEAFTWTPTLETACEIGLRGAEDGRRVGFVFLDIENVDQFPMTVDVRVASWIYALGRRSRMRRVGTVEKILRSHGITVVGPARPPNSAARLSSADLGIDSLDSLRDFRFEEAKLGFGVASSLVRYFGDSAPDFGLSRPVIDRLLNSAVQSFALSRALIEQWRPKRVLVYNGRFAVSKAVSEAARLHHVETLYHEIVSSHERFYCSSHVVHSMRNTRQDLRASWTAAGDGRELVAQQFFTPGRGGIRLFETQFLEFQRRDEIVPRSHRWRVVFFVSSIEEYASVEDGFENPLFDSQHDAARWLVSWTEAQPTAELFIRLHPRMRWLSERERGWWEALASDSVFVLPAESPVDSYSLASSADRVVAYHSSVGAEAAYDGAVSILVGDADYRGLDCVYEPRNTAELEHMLSDVDLPPKPRENCLPFGYHRLMRGEIYRFYRPASFDGGGFFGVDVTPDGEEDLLRRNAIKLMYKLDGARRTLSARRGAPRRSSERSDL